MDWQSAYWRFFNFFCRRIGAVGFVVVGLTGILSEVLRLVSANGVVATNDVPMDDHIMATGAWGLAVAIGVFMYRVAPWYPNGKKP